MQDSPRCLHCNSCRAAKALCVVPASTSGDAGICVGVRCIQRAYSCLNPGCDSPAFNSAGQQTSPHKKSACGALDPSMLGMKLHTALTTCTLSKAQYQLRAEV